MAKELRKEVEATVLYSRSPAVTMADYLRLAEDLINVGADTICINDSLGAMTPEQVASLVTTFKWHFHQPLRLHLHDSQRQAVEAYLVGVRAGAELVDTVMGPLIWSDCPPAAEQLLANLTGAAFDPHLDPAALEAVSVYLRDLKAAHRYQEPTPRKLEDTSGEGYLPGLLKDYLREELRSRQARDRLQAAYKEAHRVWQDLGFPPLKGKVLEIVGDQALANIFAGQRYEELTADMQDLIRGRYGSLYSIVDETLRHHALMLREKERNHPWEGRLRQPPGITQEEDIITFSLFPDEATYFFQHRERKQAAAAAKPAAPKPPAGPVTRLSQKMPRGLSLTLKGEEVGARLEAIGPLRGNKQTIFVTIGDMTEEIEVTFVDTGDARPEYVVTFHGETHRLKIRKVFPKEEEYTPIFLEIDDKLEEFLIKHLHID
jgi:pyruvate/oxaloacetate carboxyltransferase